MFLFVSLALSLFDFEFKEDCQISPLIYSSNNLNNLKETRKTILQENKCVSSQNGFLKSSGKISLGFVTPWNKDGSEAVLKFTNKFTHIVPTWITLEVNHDQLNVVGEDVVDNDWITSIKKLDKNVKILPRVHINIDPRSYPNIHKQVIHFIKTKFSQIFQGMPIDGVYLEFSNLLVYPQTISYAAQIMETFKKSRSKKFLTMFYMPNVARFRINLPKKLIKFTDYINMATYEIDNSPTTAPFNAIEKAAAYFKEYGIMNKAILGLPFYSINFDGMSRDYLKGTEVINRLNSTGATYSPAKANGDSAVLYKAEQSAAAAHFLSAKDMAKRIVKIVDCGAAGAAFWELGQAIPYYFGAL